MAEERRWPMKLPKVFSHFWRGRDDFLTTAEKVLGKQNVFRQKVVDKILKSKSPSYGGEDYGLMTLERLAQENANGSHWRLVWKPSISLLELRKIFPKEFCNSSVWDSGFPLLTHTGKPGYRLINFALSQKTLVRTVGEVSVAPAQLATVALALIVKQITLSKRNLKEEFHVGEDCKGVTPLLGAYDEKGMLLYTLPSDLVTNLNGKDRTGVVLCAVPAQPSLA